jgi:hypothetical protein
MQASSSLALERASVTVTRSGGLVTVSARYTSPIEVPFFGAVLDGVGLEAEATMRDEGG